VFEVDDVKLAKLDELEQIPDLYIRKKETVRLAGEADEVIECWLYVLPNFRPALLESPIYDCWSTKNPDITRRYVPRAQRTEPIDYKEIRE
jgi:gamma-glutamylcyclotransferase (GGCT)/AIG2-like uncharacterized protein YtfP